MKPANAIVLSVALAVAFGAGGYLMGKQGAHEQSPLQPAPSAPKAERRVLYWHDPMYPQQKFDKPGKSPFMNMDLVPVYADDKGDESGVAVSARVRQSLGVRAAAAGVTELRQDMQAIGYVQADERRMARAEVRTAGWI